MLRGNTDRIRQRVRYEGEAASITHRSLNYINKWIVVTVTAMGNKRDGSGLGEGRHIVDREKERS